MNKSKEKIIWQHFGFANELERETETFQTVYHHKNGKHHINFLNGKRTVREVIDAHGNKHYIAFGGKKCRMSKLPASLIAKTK